MPLVTVPRSANSTFLPEVERRDLASLMSFSSSPLPHPSYRNANSSKMRERREGRSTRMWASSINVAEALERSPSSSVRKLPLTPIPTTTNSRDSPRVEAVAITPPSFLPPTTRSLGHLILGETPAAFLVPSAAASAPTRVSKWTPSILLGLRTIERESPPFGQRQRR